MLHNLLNLHNLFLYVRDWEGGHLPILSTHGKWLSEVERLSAHWFNHFTHARGELT